MPDIHGSHRLVMLQFKPLWDYIDEVRDFCSGFVRRSFGDDEVGQGVGMIVHELVENAIRYGDEKELMLRIERSDDSIVVCVANTTTNEGGLRLRQVMQELEDLSPSEAFARALRRSTSLPAKESGLGLPRILHEGKAELQVDIAPGRVSIMARRSA
jgi:hypothetical protein